MNGSGICGGGYNYAMQQTIIAFLNNQSFLEQEVLDHFPFPGIALTSTRDLAMTHSHLAQ